MTLAGLEELPRDRFGRPLLKLPNDPEDAPRTAFTRASTLSGAIENTWNLEAWKRRLVAQGLARRPDLIAKLEGADTKTANKVVESAMQEMDIDRAASLGTHIHALTVILDAGMPIPEGEPDNVMRALEHYSKATAKWKMYGGEQFVANQQIRTAGTFDRVGMGPDGGLYALDIKTGLDAPAYAHGAQVQLAVYAHGTRYRYPGDTWDAKSLAEKGVNQEKAIMIHLPQDGSGCKLYWLDIRQGWQYAMVAAKVRSWWNVKIANPLANGSS